MRCPGTDNDGGRAWLCHLLLALRAEQVDRSGTEVLLRRNSSDDVGLDAAVVLPAEDLEGAVVAPVVVPGVGHEPVRRAALNAPTENPSILSLPLRSDFVGQDVILSSASGPDLR